MTCGFFVLSFFFLDRVFCHLCGFSFYLYFYCGDSLEYCFCELTVERALFVKTVFPETEVELAKPGLCSVLCLHLDPVQNLNRTVLLQSHLKSSPSHTTPLPNLSNHFRLQVVSALLFEDSKLIAVHSGVN